MLAPETQWHPLRCYKSSVWKNSQHRLKVCLQFGVTVRPVRHACLIAGANCCPQRKWLRGQQTVNTSLEQIQCPHCSIYLHPPAVPHTHTHTSNIPLPLFIASVTPQQCHTRCFYTFTPRPPPCLLYLLISFIFKRCYKYSICTRPPQTRFDSSNWQRTR